MASRLRFALLFPFLLILPPAAIAQTDPPQITDDSAPSETKIAAAIELLNVVHADDTLQAMLSAVIPMETQQIKRAAPTLSDDAIGLIEKNWMRRSSHARAN